MNMQPSEAEAGYDLRLPPTADPDLIRKKIAEEWAPAVRNMTYKVNEWLSFYVKCQLIYINGTLEFVDCVGFGI